jgi:hypothetical protein
VCKLIHAELDFSDARPADDKSRKQKGKEEVIFASCHAVSFFFYLICATVLD